MALINQKYLVGSLLFLFVLTILIVPVAYAQTNEIPALFEESVISATTISTQNGYQYDFNSLSNDALRVSSLLQTNSSVFTFDTFSINFFDDPIVVEKHYVRNWGDSSFNWVGKVVGNTNDSVILSVSDGEVKTGHYKTNEKSYLIKSVGNGFSVILDLDRNVEYGDDTPTEIVSSTSFVQSSQFIPGNIVEINVLAAYTPQALQDDPDIENTIEQAIESANMSYENSNLDIRLIHVGDSELVNHVETNTNDDLLLLASPFSPIFGPLHELRDEHQADVIILYEGNDIESRGPNPRSLCGQAHSIGAEKAEAFAIVSTANICHDKYTFAHELGHLQGAWHNPEETASITFAHGHLNDDLFDGGFWRTIMSYDCGVFGSEILIGLCPTQLFWSTPLQTFNGVPRGDAATEDNARMLWSTATAMSTFGFNLPDWLKTVADFWATDSISDATFLNHFNFLIVNDIITIPIGNPDGTPETVIPAWIKNNAGWWASGLITDLEYAQGFQYLVEHGIIQIGQYAVGSTLDPPVGSSASGTVTMTIDAEDPTCGNNCFIPSSISIGVGESVTFVNSKTTPTVIASGTLNNGPDDIFNSGPIGSGLSYSTTFNESGIYNYYDLVSPWMHGTINVGGIVNLQPTANAGTNDSSNEGEIVILSGVGSDPENGVLLYTWKQISGTPVLLSGSSVIGGSSNAQSTFFIAPEVTTSETLIFELTVKDDTLQSDTSTISITVNDVPPNPSNQMPTAHAGVDQEVDEGDLVELVGSLSSDPDGDSITYQWEQTVVVGDPVLFNPNVEKTNIYRTTSNWSY